MKTISGYINEAGSLNLERFEKFMNKLGNYDMEHFDEIYADLKFLESKTGRRINENENLQDGGTSPKRIMNKALSALIMNSESEVKRSRIDNIQNCFI